AGDPRPRLVPDHVAVDPLARQLRVGEGMWPGAHEAHAPLQDIDDVWQLVPRRPPAAGGGTSDARVAAPLLTQLRPIFEDLHGAEFVDQDSPGIRAMAPLPEDHRAGRIELDGSRDDRHARQTGEQQQASEYKVFRALDYASRAAERRLA